MTAMQVAGREVLFNHKGLLAYFHDWDNELAEALASDQGLTLTECHWTVINFMREYYAFHEIPPSPKVMIRAIGAEVSHHTPCTRKNLDALFPNGGCRQACHIAGLPDFYCHSC